VKISFLSSFSNTDNPKFYKHLE